MSRPKRLGLLHKLCETCGGKGLVPTSMYLDIPEHIMPLLNQGGHSNILIDEHKGRQVAVKVVRTNAASDLNVILSVSGLFVSGRP